MTTDAHDRMDCARECKFVAEKGVEMPPEALVHHIKAKRTYPFAFLRMGDSFFVPFKSDRPAAKTKTLIQQSLFSYNKSQQISNKIRLAFHVRDEGGKEGIRAWRIDTKI